MLQNRVTFSFSALTQTSTSPPQTSKQAAANKQTKHVGCIHRYVALQQVYREKAAEDLATITGTVVDSLQALGRPVDEISDGELRRLCQNAGRLHVLSTPE
jgi:hypothetical protein